MYEDGLGVPQDYIQAYAWYDLGAVNGNLRGIILRNNLAEKMSPPQIAEALNIA
jgi:TPR repeat protein